LKCNQWRRGFAVRCFPLKHGQKRVAHLEMWRPGVTPSGGQHPQAEYIVVKVRGASHIARWHADHSNSFQHGRLHNKNAASHTADRSIADLLVFDKLKEAHLGEF
jgi:hypothetical protein